MENQHRHIKGYRELSAEEIALMNDIKAKGEELEQLCNKVAAHISTQREDAKPDENETARLNRADPETWERWARSDFQAGLMFLTRAVAQPTTF